MLTQNAVRLLARYARVRHRAGAYRATVESTGATIGFEDRGGQVARIRLDYPGREPRACRSITKAVGSALSRFAGPGRAGADLLLSGGINHRGRSFDPVAASP